jgi:hypothetical protein
VKRHHRRAIVTLARHVPTLQRISAVTYEAAPTPERVAKEVAYLAELAAAGVDLLERGPHGWQRTKRLDGDRSGS